MWCARGVLLVLAVIWQLLDTTGADMRIYSLLEECRDFPKDVLPCFEDAVLRSEMRHIVYLPLLGEHYHAVELGVVSPVDQTFRVAVDVYAVHRRDEEHPYSEIVIETALDSGFSLAVGDVIGVCNNGEDCLPCADMATTRWNADPGVRACECLPNARKTADESQSALVYAPPGNEETNEPVSAWRVQCEACGEFEVASGATPPTCQCASTFGESTAIYETLLDLPRCRCEAGFEPVGSTVAGDASCEQCTGTTYKQQASNEPCQQCPPGEVTAAAGADCKCPEGFELDPASDQLALWLLSAQLPRCLCTAGHEYNAAEHRCDVCAYDSFNAASGRNPCTLCPPTLVATPDNVACHCPPYSDPVVEQTTQQVTECRCYAGYRKAADGRKCELCPENTYRGGASDAEECLPCPELTASSLGASHCSCMPGTVHSSTPALADGAPCQCDADHVLRFAEDPIHHLPSDTPAPPLTARAVVTTVQHGLYGPGRTFSFEASDSFEASEHVLEGVAVDPAVGFADVSVYLYRAATERVARTVRLYYSEPSTVWGHVVHATDSTLTGPQALASSTRTDWRAGDVLAVAALAPYNQYCFPCGNAVQCAACTPETQYLGPTAEAVCDDPDVVEALPCDSWAPPSGDGVCAPCPLLELVGAITGVCVCAAGHTADPTWNGEPATLRCLPCTAGTYKADAGDHSCALCANGEVAAPASEQCTSCAPSAAPRNSATCHPCNANSSPDAETLAVCVCDPGYTRDSETQTCVLCPADSFKATLDDVACTPCPPLASNAHVETRLSCMCDAGATHNGTACVLCPAGGFKETPGNGACTSCDVGRGTVTAGAVTPAECVCARGWYGEGDTCLQCPENTFQGLVGRVGVESCLACPFRTFQPAKGQAACAPSQVEWPFTTLKYHMVGLEVTATRSCAQLIELTDGSPVSAKKVCWGGGQPAAAVVAADPPLPDQVEAAPLLFGLTCGDGIVFPLLEACDDGNAFSTDGCSECAIDTGFACDHRDPAQYNTTLQKASVCCRADGRATCARCWDRPSPYAGVVYDGVSCELRDVDECASSQQQSCWQTGAVCENHDAVAGPDASTFLCSCDNPTATCVDPGDAGAAARFTVQMVVELQEGEDEAVAVAALRAQAEAAITQTEEQFTSDYIHVFKNYIKYNSATSTLLSVTVVVDSFVIAEQLRQAWNVGEV